MPETSTITLMVALATFAVLIAMERLWQLRPRPAGEAALLPPLRVMCHNVHMKTISIRELHLKTGRWVRHAASRGPIVVTDRGRRVASLQPFDAAVTRRPLPNRETAIRKRSKVPVDSAVYQSELREDR
jgi:antitoxin (DNA-binding transcriptional repressor) of toxin-antitoxin stability system